LFTDWIIVSLKFLKEHPSELEASILKGSDISQFGKKIVIILFGCEFNKIENIRILSYFGTHQKCKTKNPFNFYKL